jgi:hypothetical protein
MYAYTTHTHKHLKADKHHHTDRQILMQTDRRTDINFTDRQTDRQTDSERLPCTAAAAFCSSNSPWASGECIESKVICVSVCIKCKFICVVVCIESKFICVVYVQNINLSV